MSWINVLTSQQQSPSDVSYDAITIAINTVLEWPWNNTDITNVTANIMDVTATAANLLLALPPAIQASQGQSIIVRNIGINAFTVTDNSGNVIISINPGLMYFIFITDNTSVAGVWAKIQFGAGASSADAAALAGYGLKAIASKLNQDHPVSLLSSDTTIQITDRATLFTTGTGTGSFTLNLPTVVSAGNGFFFLFSNIGTGAWTIDPAGSETIDGNTSLSINPGESCEIHCSGAAWYTVGRGRSTVFVQTMLNKNVGGGVDVTLTTLEAGNIIQKYFGTLTASINVIVPAAVAIYFVENATAGAFNLTVKTASGTGVTVPQGQNIIVNCDGTNVVNSYTVIPPSSFSMADGSASSPGLPFTSDPNTGFFRPGSDQIGFAAGGQQIAIVDGNGLNVTLGNLKEGGISMLSIASVVG